MSILIDQNEIDALLQQAGTLVEQAAPKRAVAAAATHTQPPQPPPPVTPEVARILRLRVPAIVRLAETRMPVERVRRFSPGAIIEFSKSVEDDLDLLINNAPIGRGHAVKVGENFGLRVTVIGTPAQRIRSMGGQ